MALTGRPRPLMSEVISSGHPRDKDSIATGTDSKRLKLTLNYFKVPDYQMTKEMKNRISELKKTYNKIDDNFLSQFEKRYIIFIEDGIDLRNDCNCFPDNKRQKDDLLQHSVASAAVDEVSEKGLAAP